MKRRFLWKSTQCLGHCDWLARTGKLVICKRSWECTAPHPATLCSKAFVSPVSSPFALSASTPLLSILSSSSSIDPRNDCKAALEPHSGPMHCINSIGWRHPQAACTAGLTDKPVQEEETWDLWRNQEGHSILLLTLGLEQAPQQLRLYLHPEILKWYPLPLAATEATASILYNTPLTRSSTVCCLVFCLESPLYEESTAVS